MTQIKIFNCENLTETETESAVNSWISENPANLIQKISLCDGGKVLVIYDGVHHRSSHKPPYISDHFFPIFSRYTMHGWQNGECGAPLKR